MTQEEGCGAEAFAGSGAIDKLNGSADYFAAGLCAAEGLATGLRTGAAFFAGTIVALLSTICAVCALVSVAATCV